VKLVRLEVECFKCVERAELELGPGLNVLFGPNDLGKTSLGDAVRAVLLLQSTSADRKELEPWQGGGVPRVRLSFEHRERMWRVEKRFAEGTRTLALLEESHDGQVWSKREGQRAVDAELRKMLGWGVREPGGKGAPKGLPSSFITTALLGRASQLAAVFDGDLSRDSDPGGRNSLVEALQTLAEDPLFKRMLTLAQQRVDAVKRADGSFNSRRDSPIVKLGERIKQLVDEREQLTQAVQESAAIEAALRGHLERRAAHSEALESARHTLGELEALHAAGSIARGASERARRARERVAEIDTLVARRDELAGRADQLRTAIAVAERGWASADAELLAASTRERDAEAALALAQRDDGAHARAQALAEQRIDARARHERASSRRASVVAALALLDEAQASEHAAQAAGVALRRRELGHGERTQALAHARARAEEIERAASWWAWHEAAAIADGHARELAQAQSLRAQARLRREAAERELAALERDPLPERAVLELLRELEGRVQLAEHKAAVGFAVRVRLREGIDATIASDGSAARPLADAGEHAAERELVLSLGELGSIEVVAGSAALRTELADSRQRWHADALPVLTAHGVASTAALAVRIDARSERTSALQAELREASAMALQADRLDVDDARLTTARARLQQAEVAIADEDRDALEQAARTREPTALARERTELARELERARDELQRDATGLAVERAGLEHARSDAIALRSRADAAAKGHAGDLGAQRAELDDEIAAGAAELVGIDRELAGAHEALARAAALAQAELEQARVAAERAQLARSHAQTEAASLRERLAGVVALVDDADARLANLDRTAADADAARLDAELAALAAPARMVEPAELDAARDAVAAAETAVVAATDELRKAEGRLDQLRGNGSQRVLERSDDAIARANLEEQELRRDIEGWQLLRDTLRTVETEQGAHLGVALGGAIEQRLRRLTDGRYARLELDRDLRTAGLRAGGEARAIEVLSEGLKEQLATLVRLAIAEHLQTMVLLDDHLAQTDPQRVDWFRELLREVGAKVQIVVLTCRPDDYLGAHEKPDGTAMRDSDGGRVRAIDLARVIARAKA
jgi:AAA domain